MRFFFFEINIHLHASGNFYLLSFISLISGRLGNYLPATLISDNYFPCNYLTCFIFCALCIGIRYLDL